MMFITTVPQSAIDDRIAAESNAPEFAECALKLAGCGLELRQLGDVVIAPINNSIRDVTEAYQQSGGTIPLFRPADMKGAWLDPDSALRISSHFESQHAKARVVPGNIVIAAAGTVARAARVPAGIEYGAINGSCARIVVPDEADGFLLAYLISRYGFLSLMRWAVGSVQKHLNLEDIPRVVVPWTDRTVLQYIGNKVRQADRLRSDSAALMGTALALVDDLVTRRFSEQDVLDIFAGPSACDGIASKAIQNVNGESRHTRVRTARSRSTRIAVGTLSYRLDASYYTEEALSNARRLAALGAQELRSMICPTMSGYGVLPDSREYIPAGTSGVPLIRGGDLAHGGINPPEVFVPASYACERDVTFEDDILLLIKGACIDSPAGVGLVQAKDENRLFNGSCYRLRATGVDPAYLVAYFQTASFLIQKKREIANTGISYNSEDSICRFVIPRFNDSIERGIAQFVRRSLASRQFSTALVDAATRLVEALIDGKITETELRDAQLSLERGDQSRDRAILSRLTENGIDVAAKASLFPDLDSLYTAIEETQRSETSHGDSA